MAHRKYTEAFLNDVKSKPQRTRLMNILEQRQLAEPLITFLNHVLQRGFITNKRNEFERVLNEIHRKRVPRLQGKIAKRIGHLPTLTLVK
jgi:hypothetical protein